MALLHCNSKINIPIKSGSFNSALVVVKYRSVFGVPRQTRRQDRRDLNTSSSFLHSSSDLAIETPSSFSPSPFTLSAKEKKISEATQLGPFFLFPPALPLSLLLVFDLSLCLRSYIFSRSFPSLPTISSISLLPLLSLLVYPGESVNSWSYDTL
ncbi:hypothetical protein Bca101_043339 [Brassica carinata]